MTNNSPRTKTRSASKGAEGGRHDRQRGAKGHRLVQLLRPRAGLDIAALSGKLGWQPHSTRAALSRLRQAGYAIEKARTSATSSSPLAGKFIDETGDRLTPSHAVRRGKRHRYYVSRRLIANSGEPDLSGWRLPAAALEGAVAKLIIDTLEAQTVTLDLITVATPETLRTLPSAAKSLVVALRGPDRAPTLKALVNSGRIELGRLSVTLAPPGLAERVGVPIGQINPDALSLAGKFTLRRRGVEAKLLIGNSSPAVDRTLLKSVALGWVWFEEIKAGATMQAIANREGITQRRVAHLVDLAFLAPDIVQAIVDGRQSPTLTADSLIKSRHRMLWVDQRAWISAL